RSPAMPKRSPTARCCSRRTASAATGPAARGAAPTRIPIASTTWISRAQSAGADSQQEMDLAVAKRGPRNPDGVVFYKVWNGRKKPKMPAFKDELSKDQVWRIVSYAQTLRAKEEGAPYKILGSHSPIR